jgi:hypothetical protein
VCQCTCSTGPGRPTGALTALCVARSLRAISSFMMARMSQVHVPVELQLEVQVQLQLLRLRLLTSLSGVQVGTRHPRARFPSGAPRPV